MADVGSIRILIAEDDDNARALLVQLLNTMGHVVVAEVSGGREAIERTVDVVPDVVRLDVHMPDGTVIGYDPIEDKKNYLVSSSGLTVVTRDYSVYENPVSPAFLQHGNS